MINIKKRELLELASVYVIANTPESLARGLLATSAVQTMRYDERRSELSDEYHIVTTRPSRTEISMGLAYALLVSIVLNERDEDPNVTVDESRLQWGEQVAEAATALAPPSQSLIISAPAPPARVRSDNEPPRPTIYTGRN